MIRILIIACLVFVGLSACSPVSNTGAPSDSFSSQNSGNERSTENTSGTGDVAYTDPDGRRGIYNEQWQNGTPHGQDRVEYDDGSTYVGSFVAGQRSGRGTWIHPDGAQYEGQWRDGSQNGRGSLTYPDGRWVEGEWRGGARIDDFIEFIEQEVID